MTSTGGFDRPNHYPVSQVYLPQENDPLGAQKARYRSNTLAAPSTRCDESPLSGSFQKGDVLLLRHLNDPRTIGITEVSGSTKIG